MKLVVHILLLLIAMPALSQTRISGRVTDVRGQAVPMANVILAGTYDGATTDTQGSFEFTTAEKGHADLVVTFVGFLNFRRQVELTGSSLVITVQLLDDVRALEAVTISAGAFDASDASRRTVFRALDIATTAGATADIAGALNTLPGTQKVGEQGRLFVRGGDSRETRTFIDGLLILDPYAPSGPNAPSRQRFLPFMFKGISFSTGGYSAEYGQALASTLALDSRDKGETTRTDAGLLSVGADIGHTQVWERGSAGGKIQYTNIRPYFSLIRQETDWITPPASLEGSAAYRQQSGKSGLLKVFGNFSRVDFSLYDHAIDPGTSRARIDRTNRYGYLNGFYRNELGKNWSIRGGISFTRVHNITSRDQEGFEEASTAIHAKTVLEGSVSTTVALAAGVEVIDRTAVSPGGGKAPGFEEAITASFAEADVFLTRNFIARSGVRVEYNALGRALGADPRLSLAHRAGDNGQVSLAFGTFRQSPEDRWLSRNRNLRSEEADHYILNYQHMEEGRTFRAEVYCKKYKDLVKFPAGLPARSTNDGHGFARGVEVFWRDNRTLRNVDYWISYSLLDTRRDYHDFPAMATPAFASAHNLSIVYKHFITPLKSQLGLTQSVTTGRPYHDPNAGGFNLGKTPSYADLSFNWSYLPHPSLIVHFSCTNLLARDHIFGYEYSSIPDEAGRYNGRAIRQPARHFVFLGIFLTLSKDQTVNQLPSL